MIQTEKSESRDLLPHCTAAQTGHAGPPSTAMPFPKCTLHHGQRGESWDSESSVIKESHSIT